MKKIFKVTKEVSADIIKATNTCHIGNINVVGVNYFVKPDDEQKEIIGYKLACLASILAVPYYSIKVRNKNYAVCRNLKDLGAFVSAENIMGNETDITFLISKIRQLVFYSVELEKQFYQMYFFDFLFLNSDGYPRNFGFFNDFKKWRLIVYDHINIFDFKFPLALRYNPNNFVEAVSMENYYQDFYDLFISLPEEFQNIFIKMYELYSLDNVSKLLMDINPDEAAILMSIYEPHYKKVGEILNRGIKYGR